MQMQSSACLTLFQASIFPAFQLQSALGVWLPNLLLVALLVFALLNGILRRIPSHAEDAALLDGCGFWRTLSHLVVPRLGPLLLVVAFTLLLTGWEDVMAPRVVIYRSHPTVLASPGKSDDLAVMLAFRSALIGGNIHDSGARVAALMILFTPVLAFFYLALRYLFQGRFTVPRP